MLSQNEVIVAIYPTHEHAEIAVMELHRTGFDMRNVSIIGRDYQTDDHVVGYYKASERMKYWGKMGDVWSRLWQYLFGSAFFYIPGIGPLLVAGPLVGWIGGALEGAVVVGGVSAVGAGLGFLGIPKENIIAYEAALTAGKFIVIVHGSANIMAGANEIIIRTDPESIEEHLHSHSDNAA